MSCTVIPPWWLKSALQQGVLKLPAVLQLVVEGTKSVCAPVQADARTLAWQAEPLQQVPGAEQVEPPQTVPPPWKIPPRLAVQSAAQSE